MSFFPREQGRGEGRGRSGVGGHRSGCNKGNCLENLDCVMGETMAGSGVVGSVSGGDVSERVVVVVPVVRVVEVPLRQSLMKSKS